MIFASLISLTLLTHTVSAFVLSPIIKKAAPPPGFYAGQYGVDYPNHDISASVNGGCYALCLANPLCVAVVEMRSNPKFCWLKSTIGTPSFATTDRTLFLLAPVYAPSVVGMDYAYAGVGGTAPLTHGECHALCSVSDACIAVVTMTSNPLNCWMRNSLGAVSTTAQDRTVTMKAKLFGPSMNQGIDFPGNDINEYFNGECRAACANDPNCVAVVEVASDMNHCWTKFAISDPVNVGDRAISFRTFGLGKVEWGVDYPYNDIVVGGGDCIQKCALLPSCVGVSQQYPDVSLCWLKSKFDGPGVQNGNRISYHK